MASALGLAKFFQPKHGFLMAIQVGYHTTVCTSVTCYVLVVANRTSSVYSDERRNINDLYHVFWLWPAALTFTSNDLTLTAFLAKYPLYICYFIYVLVLN